MCFFSVCEWLINLLLTTIDLTRFPGRQSEASCGCEQPRPSWHDLTFLRAFFTCLSLFSPLLY